MAIPAAKVDFTQYQSVYSDTKISEFPPLLQGAVERIRYLQKNGKITREAEPIGVGASGSAFKATYPYKNSVETCVVKLFFRSSDLWKETGALWKSIGVPHAVQLHGICIDGDSEEANALIMDYIPAPPLLKSPLDLSLSDLREQVIEVGRQLLQFLSAFQKPAVNRNSGMIHGDLAPSNLIWHNRHLTVIDFGLACEINELYTPVIQKGPYRAPEVFLKQTVEDNSKCEPIGYNESVDLWSVATIIHEMITGYSFLFENQGQPYGHFEISTLVHRIGMPERRYLKLAISTAKFFKEKDGGYVFNDKLAAYSKRSSLKSTHEKSPTSTPEFFDFVCRILVWDPYKRPTVDEALKHPLFTSSKGSES